LMAGLFWCSILMKMKDSLSAQTVSTGLPNQLIGKKVLFFPRVTSTMDIAREAAGQGAPEGTVVLADEQTAGRGRMRRSWFSPQGSISLSVLLYPQKSFLPYLVMLASLAVVHCIEKVAGVKADIKWPNDVLIKGKKVCGILLESDVREEKVAYAIIGIGINVNMNLADFTEIAAIATSLSQETGKEFSRLALARELLVELEKMYLTLPAGDAIHKEWKARLITLGKSVLVKSGGAFLKGIAEDVTAEGRLLLRQADGSMQEIIAGDVTLREP